MNRRALAPCLLRAALLLGLAGLGACESDGGPVVQCATNADCSVGTLCHQDDDEFFCVSPAAGLPPMVDMVAVPGGPFAMGCNAAQDERCEDDELPQHTVDVPVFEIDRTEVTTTAFAAFLSAWGNTCEGELLCTNYFEPPPLAEDEAGRWTPEPGAEREPIRSVTWFAARDFCAWMGLELCTEAQWEKAARGGCDLREADCATAMPTYPWGDDAPTCTLTQMNGEVDWGCDAMVLADVGTHPDGASPYGALDMAGNVWEWVADSYHPDYEEGGEEDPGPPLDGSAWITEGQKLRIIRGGGAYSGVSELRSAFRGDGGAQDSSKFRGFRCCRWMATP